MALNTNQIRQYFNAGLATIAVNSATASELTVTEQLFNDF